MRAKLLMQAIIKFTMGLVMVAALLFLPAGGFDYWNGWLFLGLLFIPMFLLGVVLLVKSPELLAKRLQSKEKEEEQKLVVLGSGIAFVLFLFYPLLLVKRIRNEEAVLEKGLDGYKEYKEKVKYRMFPFIW